VERRISKGLGVARTPVDNRADEELLPVGITSVVGAAACVRNKSSNVPLRVCTVELQDVAGRKARIGIG